MIQIYIIHPQKGLIKLLYQRSYKFILFIYLKNHLLENLILHFEIDLWFAFVFSCTVHFAKIRSLFSYLLVFQTSQQPTELDRIDYVK